MVILLGKRAYVQRKRWHDNLKTNFKERGCDHGRFVKLAQDRVQCVL
jgi:hypothetical protein